MKTIDYLMAIHLQPVVRDRGAFDVLYQKDGIITECPRCNFFIVTAKGTLVTPVRNMLKGITRMKVLEFAYANTKVEERDVLLDELSTANEAFITSTSRHIIPVSHLDDLPIGPAAATPAGPLTRKLNSLLYDLVNSKK